MNGFEYFIHNHSRSSSSNTAADVYKKEKKNRLNSQAMAVLQQYQKSTAASANSVLHSCSIYCTILLRIIK